jgi:hypothetical protein
VTSCNLPLVLGFLLRWRLDVDLPAAYECREAWSAQRCMAKLPDYVSMIGHAVIDELFDIFLQTPSKLGHRE